MTEVTKKLTETTQDSKLTKIAEANWLSNLKDIWENISPDSSIKILEKAKELFDPKNANNRTAKEVYMEMYNKGKAKAWRLWKILVYAIQKVLKITVDGVIGDKTKAAIIKFQTSYNWTVKEQEKITIDWICGPLTIWKLLEKNQVSPAIPINPIQQPTKISDISNTTIVNISAKINEEKNRESSYLSEFRKISDEKFSELFGGLDKIQQWNLGDCYLITAINVLARSKYFDTLTKTSLSIKDDMYEIIMPLGEPGGKKLQISNKELNLAKVWWAIGYKLLEVAFAKYILNQTTLDALDYAEMNKIKWGYSGCALQTLLWWKNLNSFQISAQKNNTIIFKPDVYNKSIDKQKTLSNMNEKTKSNIINLLKTYNLSEWKWFLTANTIMWSSDRISYNIWKHTLYKSHAYAIIWTTKDASNNIRSVSLLNPRNKEWDKWTFELTIQEFMSGFESIEANMLTTNFLNKTTHPTEITITDTPNRKRPINTKIKK